MPSASCNRFHAMTYGGGGGASFSVRLAKWRRTNQTVTATTTSTAIAPKTQNTHSLPVGISTAPLMPRISATSPVTGAFVASIGSGKTSAAELVFVVGIRQPNAGASCASQKSVPAPSHTADRCVTEWSRCPIRETVSPTPPARCTAVVHTPRDGDRLRC